MDSTRRDQKAQQQKASPIPYVAVSLVAGAAFAIVAVVGAPGIAYVIVAIVAGLCYSLITVMNRRRG
jgi:Flp pilus assembly protein TadB